MNKPKTKQELIQLCKDLKIKNYSSKTKDEIIRMLELHSQMQPSPPPPPIQEINPTPPLSETADDEVGSGRSGGDNIQITSQPLNLTSNANLRFADLFCGIGGFHQALKRINATCVFACDIDEKCRQIYKRNYGIEPHADIRTVQPITLPDFDILTGGFPCQSFSNSGKKRGLEDKRGQLFEYILDIAIVKQPSLMFLENVKHIKKINNGEVFAHIISRIKETGYTVYTVELSPHQLGIPQHRERVVFVCIRQDLHKTTYTFPIPDNAPPMRFECIFETDSHITDKYKISNEEEQLLNAWNEMVSVFDTGENLSPTIMCNEFYKTYTEPEFNALPAWKKEYITKNQPIYHKYKKQ